MASSKRISSQPRPDERRFQRVGHRGAPALAPENTIASLEAALAHGVDGVEFDVLAHGGELLIAHSPSEIPAGRPTLADALAFLAEHSPAAVAVHVDLKERGYEEDVVEALRSRGLVSRALVCSFLADSLVRVRTLEPALRTGIAYPRDRHGVARRRVLTPVVRAGLVTLRPALPYRIGRMLAAARADVALVHHLVLSPPLVTRCHALGAPVFAWTVDTREDLERVLAAGADGVLSNDPRVFAC